jgi:predicted dehydrogenase
MRNDKKKIRYAVVGLGHITQVAVLPAFKASGNSELVTIVSGDADKRKKLSANTDSIRLIPTKTMNRPLHR